MYQFILNFLWCQKTESEKKLERYENNSIWKITLLRANEHYSDNQNAYKLLENKVGF